MKIGVLKSRVEKLLSESYGKGTFKEEIKNFNRNVLSNKNISKLFFLYDELSTNKGYDQKLAEDFVFESITMFENIITSSGFEIIIAINTMNINLIKIEALNSLLLFLWGNKFFERV